LDRPRLKHFKVCFAAFSSSELARRSTTQQFHRIFRAIRTIDIDQEEEEETANPIPAKPTCSDPENLPRPNITS
jgi:hypothetical protein